MLFSLRKQKKKLEKKFKININYHNIEQVTEMKYLGVILDNKLNWHSHIQYTCSKLAKAAGIIFKLQRRLPRKILLLLYHGLFATYLQYGIVVWGTAKSTARTKLKTLQNKVIRHMTFSDRCTNIQHFFKILNILKVEDIHFLEVSKFMYKNANKTLPQTFSEFFRHINHHHETRTKARSNFVLPKPRTNFGKQSLKYNGVKVWSEIPYNIRTALSKDLFTSQVKDYLLNKY